MLPILQSIHHLLSTKSTAWSFAFIPSNSLPCFIFISIHLLHFPKSSPIFYCTCFTCCFFDPIRIYSDISWYAHHFPSCFHHFPSWISSIFPSSPSPSPAGASASAACASWVVAGTTGASGGDEAFEPCREDLLGRFLRCGWWKNPINHRIWMVETSWNPINHGINHGINHQLVQDFFPPQCSDLFVGGLFLVGHVSWPWRIPLSTSSSAQHLCICLGRSDGFLQLFHFHLGQREQQHCYLGRRGVTLWWLWILVNFLSILSIWDPISDVLLDFIYQRERSNS